MKIHSQSPCFGAHIWKEHLLFLWPSVFSSIQREGQIRSFGSLLALSIFQGLFDFCLFCLYSFFMLHAWYNGDRNIDFLSTEIWILMQILTLFSYLPFSKFTERRWALVFSTLKQYKHTYLVDMLKILRANLCKSFNIAQWRNSINGITNCLMFSLYSFAIWFYHHICGSFSSGPSFGFVKQHHWNQAGCIQICHPVAEASAGQSHWHR